MEVNVQPQISICRKRENLYLKLKGDVNWTSSEEILRAMKRLVATSLQISSPNTRVLFTLRTHAKVEPRRKAPPGPEGD